MKKNLFLVFLLTMATTWAVAGEVRSIPLQSKNYENNDNKEHKIRKAPARRGAPTIDVGYDEERGVLVFECSHSSCMADYIIKDVYGGMVLSGSIFVSAGFQSEVSLSDLPDEFYTITITAGGKTYEGSLCL